MGGKKRETMWEPEDTRERERDRERMDGWVRQGKDEWMRGMTPSTINCVPRGHKDGGMEDRERDRERQRETERETDREREREVILQTDSRLLRHHRE